MISPLERKPQLKTIFWPTLNVWNKLYFNVWLIINIKIKIKKILQINLNIKSEIL